MTLAEAAGRYSIPPDILQEYRSLGFAPGDTVDDTDLERLGTLIALHDLGLTAEEAGKYLRLTEAGGCGSECLRILDGAAPSVWTTYTGVKASSAAWTICATSCAVGRTANRRISRILYERMIIHGRIHHYLPPR